MATLVQTNLPSLQDLPQEFVIDMPNFSAISLKGEEKSKYLQGQVTCDVNELTDDSILHGGHCDAKGKVLSIFRLINRDEAHLLLQSKDSIEKSLSELNKFGVFAKVDIAQPNDIKFIALVGENVVSKLKTHFGKAPDSLTPVVQCDSTSIVYIAGKVTRYLIIDNSINIDNFVSSLELPIYNENIWRLLEISEGFPMLNSDSITQYVPQMLNLDAIHGISFTKGCYLGQETVARMQYLGKNKKVMALIKGNIDVSSISSTCSSIKLEKQLGENWRSAGDILNCYCSDNGDIYLQAVIAKDIEADTSLRLSKVDSSACISSNLTMSSLPYAMTDLTS